HLVIEAGGGAHAHSDPPVSLASLTGLSWLFACVVTLDFKQGKDCRKVHHQNNLREEKNPPVSHVCGYPEAMAACWDGPSSQLPVDLQYPSHPSDCMESTQLSGGAAPLPDSLHVATQTPQGAACLLLRKNCPTSSTVNNNVDIGGLHSDEGWRTRMIVIHVVCGETGVLCSSGGCSERPSLTAHHVLPDQHSLFVVLSLSSPSLSPTHTLPGGPRTRLGVA
ncbi:hypothetical protein KUCAC02_035428, partial [Chaenocephalus aceratus]